MSRDQNNLFVLLIVAILLTSCNPAASPPGSPCPSLFSYQYDPAKSEYYGLVNLQTQPVQNSAEVTVSFSIAAHLPSATNIGSIETVGENRALFEQIAKGRGVSYRVNLPSQNPLPRLTKLTLNGATLCSGPAEEKGVPFVSEVNLRHFLRSDAATNWQRFSSGKPVATTSLPVKSGVDQFKLVDHREQNQTEERTEQEVGPNRNSTSYKIVTQTITYKEFVSAPMVQKTSHYYVNTTTREQV
ncbi:hypothetical protein quinque_000288 [Culex quinquefasciatus]